MNLHDSNALSNKIILRRMKYVHNNFFLKNNERPISAFQPCLYIQNTNFIRSTATSSLERQGDKSTFE